MFIRLSTTKTINLENILSIDQYPDHIRLIMADGVELKLFNHDQQTNINRIITYTDANQIS